MENSPKESFKARSSSKTNKNNSISVDGTTRMRSYKKGFNYAKNMLLQSIKKDKTAEKMSFATGTALASESNEDVDEILEQLLDQLEAAQLSDQMMEEYTEIYLILDPNNDGYIDPPKLFKALHAVGFEPTESEIMDIIDAVDINKSCHFIHSKVYGL